MRTFAAMLRSTPLRLATVVAIVGTVIAVQSGTAGAIPPAVLTASASPSSASSGETVTVTVDVAGCWMNAPEPGDVANVYLYPSTVGRYDGKTTTLNPEIVEGSGGGEYRATATVAVDELVGNAGGTAGTFQIDAGVNGACDIILQENVDQVTLSAAPATTTTTTTTTTAPGAPDEVQVIIISVTMTMIILTIGQIVHIIYRAKTPQEAFESGSRVDVAIASDPRHLTTFTADADGNVTGSFTLPDDVPLGEHTLWLTGTSSTGQPLWARQPVTVTAPGVAAVGTDTPPGELAFTGRSTPTPLIGLGFLLMLLGLGALFVARQPEPVLVEMRSLRPIEPIEPGTRPGRRRRRAPQR